MDVGQTIATLAAAQSRFERLVEAVAAAEGAFRRLAAGVATGAPAAVRGTDPLERSVDLERRRLRLIDDGNAAWRERRDLVDEAAVQQELSAARLGVAWDGFGQRLATTFSSLFSRIVREGELRFADLFRSLEPQIAGLIGRLTGFDPTPVIGAVGRLLGGRPGGSPGGLLGQAAGLFGPLLGLLPGGGGAGGLVGMLAPWLGGAPGAAGGLLPIPGASLIAATLPLVAGLFADRDYPFAKAGIGVAGGSVTSDPFALDDGPLDQVRQLGAQVAATLQDILDRLGATVADIADLTAVGYASGRKPTLPKGFFAGIDDTRGADFATGALFAGLADPGEAVLRAVQSGLLRGLHTGAARGIDPGRAETLALGLRRAMAAPFSSLEDGLADLAFLGDFGRTLERFRAAGDPAATQRLDLRDSAEAAAGDDADRIRDFLERAGRLFAPLPATPSPAVLAREADTSRPAAFVDDEGRRVDGTGPAAAGLITDEGSVVGVLPERTLPEMPPVIELSSGDDDLAAGHLAEARAAVEEYVRALLGIEGAVADTRPLTGYALQLAEAELRIDAMSSALREAGYSADQASELIQSGQAAARDRLRAAYEEDLGRDLRDAGGLGAVDRVAGLVDAYETRRAEGQALGADVSRLDELLRLQVEALVTAGGVSVAALDALREAFAGNAIVTEALNRSLTLQAAAANDNIAAQLTLADVTRLATRELDAQVREQEQVKRSAEAVVDAIADTRRRIALDPALSALSPAEQLEEARIRFADLSARSLAGDQAAQAELPDAGEAYLELARDFYASSEDYARIFREVDSALRETGALADRQLLVAEAQLQELQELRRALTGELAGLPNPEADFGRKPTRNRILARLTGYAGDFGGGGFAAFRTGLSPDIAALVDAIASAVNFADGGVMTVGGPLQLHRYASGGIARQPQLALFGEGRLPEAFVPLPDGRSIPVTVTAPSSNASSGVVGAGGADAGAARRTAGVETLVEETRRLRTDVAGLRGDNAALRRALERLTAGMNTGRAA